MLNKYVRKYLARKLSDLITKGRKVIGRLEMFP